MMAMETMVSQKKTPWRENQMEQILYQLAGLMRASTAKERLEAFRMMASIVTDYCVGCGSDDPKCQCDVDPEYD